jgi:hypothetical protein
MASLDVPRQWELLREFPHQQPLEARQFSHQAFEHLRHRFTNHFMRAPLEVKNRPSRLCQQFAVDALASAST